MTVADRWRTSTSSSDPCYDLDGDGRITVIDIMLVAAEWGRSCP
jgi:hypothetical protein